MKQTKNKQENTVFMQQLLLVFIFFKYFIRKMQGNFKKFTLIKILEIKFYDNMYKRELIFF